MPTQCCVYGCSKLGGHSFPWSNPTRVRAWERAISRGNNWKPTRNSVVCQRHFSADDYIQSTCVGTVPLQKRLKATAVPHIFDYKAKVCKGQAALNREERALKRQAAELEAEEQRDSAWQALGAVEEVDVPDSETTGAAEDNDAEDENNTIQDHEAVGDQIPKSTADASVQCVQKGMSAMDFRDDPQGMHFYTGLESYSNFRFVLSTLGQAAYDLQYFHGVEPILTIEDQFFVTLVKLRQHKINFEMSRMFRVDPDCITNIVVTWINFMAHQWGEVNWWPSRDLVHYYAPSDFFAKYPKTRVIVDGTECPVQKPKQPVIQQASFSTYKNRNTMKVLVGCTPAGLVSFVSTAYCGSASDRQIVERSQLTQMCDPGDDIMADKGFDVQDLFVPYKVTINIPTFFKKKNRMSGDTVLKDRKIASKRVHVERIIGLAKTFKILKAPLNNTESNMATEIIKVCFYLCNFKSGIVSEKA